MSARRFVIAMLLLLVAFPATAADIIDFDMVYEIRAAGGTDNGCGFETGASGTDYSQQDSAHQTYSDLAIDATTNTDISSAADPFASDDVGNVIKITGGTGFTTGYYVIKSIEAGPLARLDRAVGTTSSTGGSGTLGGACIFEDEIFEAAYDANILYVKADSTYTLAADVDVGNDGDSEENIKVIGYNTTRGDAPLPGSGNQPDINAGSNRIRWDDNWALYYLDIDTTDFDGIRIDIEGGYFFNTLRNSTGSGGASAIYEFGGGDQRIVGNWIRADNGYAIGRNRRGYVYKNYIYDSANGINSSTNEFTYIIGNVFDTITGVCADVQFVGAALENTFYSCGTGINAEDSSEVTIMNNIFDNCTTAVSFDTEIVSTFLDFNNYTNNSTDVNNTTKGPHATADSPGFADASGGNFAVGTNMKAAAFPSSFGSSTSNYQDLGAVQREEPAGGGGSGASAYTYVQ